MNQSRKPLFAIILIGLLSLACALETRLPTKTPAIDSSTSTNIPMNMSFTPTMMPSETANPPSDTQTPTPSATVAAPLRFAVIGDYGSGNNDEKRVADLVKSWKVDFIVTTGDNNYPIGSAETIDAHVGQFYQEFIAPYKGIYGDGAQENRFFPSLGNHDWMSEGAKPYLDYFTLPGNERYYDFTWGVVHIFVVDSDSNEPDGVGRSSRQAQWLQERLNESTSAWQIVVMHHPPYTSGLRGPVEWIRWPFVEWGVDAVLCGHDHYYERLIVDGLVYIINGAGGGGLYDFGIPAEGSQKRFNGDYGALLVTVDENNLFFQFFTPSGNLIDEYRIQR